MNWIRRGLRFECQPDCGKCCTTKERDGSIYLEPVDIETLSQHLGMAPRTFVTELTVTEVDDIELAKKADGSCVFLENKRCSVYEARPLQCQAYPFLPLDTFAPVESPWTWRNEGKFCPGIGKGRLYRKADIAKIMRGQASTNDSFD